MQRRVFAILACLTAFAPLAIDLYLPSFGDIAASLNTPFSTVQQTVSVFLLGFAVGMLFYGPLSDRFGRKKMIIFGLCLFILASAACTFAQSIEQLLLFRIIQAFGGGAAGVISRAIVRDLFSEKQAARVIALLAMTTSLAPLCAPLLGAGILALGSWRYEFAALTLFGLFSLFSAWKVLPETLKSNPKGHSLKAAFTGYLTVLKHPESRTLILSGGSLFAAMFAYITGTPFVYIELYQLPKAVYGLLFGANITSLILFGYITSKQVKTLGTGKLIRWGGRVALTGAILVLLSTWLGITHSGSLPLLVCGLLLSVGALGLIAPNAVARLMEHFPSNAGAASALFGCAQFGLGTLASELVARLHNGTAQPMAWVIAGFVLLSFFNTQKVN